MPFQPKSNLPDFAALKATFVGAKDQIKDYLLFQTIINLVDANTKNQRIFSKQISDLEIVTAPGSMQVSGAGEKEIDFGVFPGVSDTTVAVTGQGLMEANALVHSWVLPKATTDHTIDEHMVESIKFETELRVGGTGFTVHGFNTSEINEPSGQGTRIFGKWNVAWRWSNPSPV